MLNNAEIAMIVLLILAFAVVYFGVYKAGDNDRKLKDQKLNSTKNNTSLNQHSIARAALQVYFNLCLHWSLTNEQQKTLLGNPTDDEYELWVANTTDIVLDRETLERISHLINIYSNLVILLPSDEAAHTWIRRKNTAPLFTSDTALNYMLKSGVYGLKQVRHYLNGECL